MLPFDVFAKRGKLQYSKACQSEMTFFMSTCFTVMSMCNPPF